ncbi:aldehyde ferredoxin oxidoreductase family protein [Desulfoscipio gibsoniae]|uniref:Aldehyde:ferredoxin oxidoreductase n=1 Tax=Desulfoscipio gibsoniae DSM 7213 TaxID=767817 RepID=R4KNV1_9FIRM|nr:aldehyde ferredoxin oxidoreductase family protein [Desulfoscipio gibsoniae]AGL03242.1 aldehyde:ferredoxin oxidoreductase [Desulfoscipio gibsoniae DSM 7213]
MIKDRARPICHNAVVNLTEQTVEYMETPQEILKKFVGGRGLNMYYLYKYLKPHADPLSPDNVLIIGTGLLTGTLSPNSGRYSVTCISPESGIIGDANIGGFFGAEMRFAGIDRLIITGKAASPVYLYLENGRVEIRDASAYWGQTCSNTQRKLKVDLGSDVEISCIGPSGESMVRFSSVMSGVKNAAGRCGTGAVMGSKNLKAIVARGNYGLPIADPKGMINKYIELRNYLKKSKVTQVLGRVGTPLLYDVSNYLGAIRTHNSQQTVFYDTLNAEKIHKYVDKMLSCYGCIIHCRHRNKLGGEGPEYTTEVMLGANIGVADTYQMIDLNNIANDLGLDVSSLGTYIAWAIELFEKGYITEKSVGYPLQFGDYEMARRLIEDIAYRRGFGDTLAEGSRLVSKYGPETADFLIAVKGLPQSDPHDVRYIKAFSLGIATSSRGADHLRSRPTLEILDLPPDVTERIYGGPVDPNPMSYTSKGRLVYFSDNIYAVVDSMGICKFACQGFNSPRNLNYNHFCELTKLAVGLEFNKEELEQVGRRVIDMERLINYTVKGITRKDDTLPARYFDEPMPSARAKGSHIDRQGFDKMLDDYYSLRGWTADGRLTPARVAEFEKLRDYLH